MKNGIKDRAVVLKRVNSGEADRILTLYSEFNGKIRVKAKGVRKLNSRKGGNVEVFNQIKFATAPGHVLHVITEVETLESLPALRIDLTRIGVGFHLCELVERFLPDHQPHKEVFELLIETLSEASSCPTPELRFIVKTFETELLTILGFGLPPEVNQKTLVQHMELILERPLKSRLFLNRISEDLHTSS